MELKLESISHWFDQLSAINYVSKELVGVREYSRNDSHASTTFSEVENNPGPPIGCNTRKELYLSKSEWNALQ